MFSGISRRHVYLHDQILPDQIEKYHGIIVAKKNIRLPQDYADIMESFNSNNLLYNIL